MRKLILSMVAMALFAATGLAEVFVLKNREQVEGTIARIGADGRVTVKMKSGVRSYRVSEFSEETRAKHFANVKVASALPTKAARSRSSRAQEPRKMTGVDAPEEKAAVGVVIAGVALVCIGGLWMLIAAFAESPIWGIAFLLSGGGAELAFMFLHWDRAKGPIITQLLGAGLFVAAIVLAK